MKWDCFIKTVRNLPVIDINNLVSGNVLPISIRVQVSRWHKAGKVVQLKRGLYLLSQPYRRVKVSEFYLASILKMPSYISLEKALEYYNLIPEGVPVFTSVTGKRPRVYKNEVGVFEYRHIKSALFWGYISLTLDNQTGFMALPEKALLDLFYLKPGKVTPDYLEGLRLQNLESVNFNTLLDFAKKFNKPKSLEDARTVKKYIETRGKTEKKL